MCIGSTINETLKKNLLYSSFFYSSLRVGTYGKTLLPSNRVKRYPLNTTKTMSTSSGQLQCRVLLVNTGLFQPPATAQMTSSVVVKQIALHSVLCYFRRMKEERTKS